MISALSDRDGESYQPEIRFPVKDKIVLYHIDIRGHLCSMMPCLLI